MFYGTFKSLSNEYKEAAIIDGASDYCVLFKIVFPLVKSVMLATFVLNFIAFWNDYQTPLLYLPTHPTLAYAVYYVSYEAFEPALYHTPPRIAGLMLLAVPIVILFAIFKDKLMGDISLGGIKE